MTTESDALREALFAQMRVPPLPEYSGDAVILRACKMPTPNSVAHHMLPLCADGSLATTPGRRSVSSTLASSFAGIGECIGLRVSFLARS
jgi:hypothetical protein